MYSNLVKVLSPSYSSWMECSSITGEHDEGYVMHATVSSKSKFVSNVLPIFFLAYVFISKTPPCFVQLKWLQPEAKTRNNLTSNSHHRVEYSSTKRYPSYKLEDSVAFRIGADFDQQLLSIPWKIVCIKMSRSFSENILTSQHHIASIGANDSRSFNSNYVSLTPLIWQSLITNFGSNLVDLYVACKLVRVLYLKWSASLLHHHNSMCH